MKFSINRDTLLRPLVIMAGVVPRRPTQAVLAHVLVEATEEGLTLVALDLEVQLKWKLEITSLDTPGVITLPAKKLTDICRSLDEGSTIDFILEENRLVVKSGRSRFVLATLPAEEFPSMQLGEVEQEIKLSQAELLTLIRRTDFAMGRQDVRFYLNGMFFELEKDKLTCVTTDGHRLAVASTHSFTASQEKDLSMIVPGKAINDLAKLLEPVDDEVTLGFGSQHFEVQLPYASFASKHIDGQYPNYKQVIPANNDKTVICNKLELRQILSRISILANEKLLGIHLYLSTNELKVVAKNPEQEQAEESLNLQYEGENLEIGFNVSYLLDVLDNLGDEANEVEILLADPSSSALIRPTGATNLVYVVMPMRI